jgi:hypothetical protein
LDRAVGVEAGGSEGAERWVLPQESNVVLGLDIEVIGDVVAQDGADLVDRDSEVLVAYVERRRTLVLRWNRKGKMSPTATPASLMAKASVAYGASSTGTAPVKRTAVPNSKLFAR